MVKKVVYTKNDKVVIESLDANQTDSYYLNLFNNRGFTDALIIDDSLFPDTEYLEAWEINQSSIIINMTKARNVKKQKLENECEQFLPEVQNSYLDAFSKKKNSENIESRLIYLKELPNDPRIDEANSIDDLNAITIDSWVPPDIDLLDEDTSKIPIVQYQNSETITSTTSQDYIQKLSINITTKNSLYLIWYYAEIYTSNRNRRISTRVQIDNTETIHECSTIPSASKNGLGWGSLSGEYVTSFTEGSHFIDLDFKSNGSSVSIRRSRIYVTEIISGN